MREEQGSDHARWVCDALDRFEGPLLAYAARLLGDAHRAQDVVQDAFLALCREDRHAIGAALAPWLYAVTRNRALNERRREGREVSAGAEPAAPASDPGPRAEARDAAAQALLALDRLPDGQQEALRLKFQHGLRYRDIGEVMRVTPGHVAVLVHRGISTLRSRLGVAAGTRTPAPGAAP